MLYCNQVHTLSLIGMDVVRGVIPISRTIQTDGIFSSLLPIIQCHPYKEARDDWCLVLIYGRPSRFLKRNTLLWGFWEDLARKLITFRRINTKSRLKALDLHIYSLLTQWKMDFRHYAEESFHGKIFLSFPSASVPVTHFFFLQSLGLWSGDIL